MTGAAAEEKCPDRLRRVEVYDPATEDTLVFLTNHLTFGATTIAAIYKDRWQIELFFTLHGGQPSEAVHRLMREADIFVKHSTTDPDTGDEERLPVAILEAMVPAYRSCRQHTPESPKPSLTALPVIW